ncbi:hypothetical protein [Kordia jejudonensis]|uniref:hypothetical protein n=1 Tax=Kordia jejudonensis TaxID=1348245 RepID=UPI0012E089B4|nr:hypothetical protein [Kordia jejudonensis]
MKKPNTHTKEYSKEMERWKHEDVLQLANHFHRLKENQFERSNEFAMQDDDVALFETVKEHIKTMKIYLALDAKEKEKFTFFPILYIDDHDGNKYHFKMYDKASESSHGEAEFVPEIFKNMIAKNWSEIDFHLIDDLFTARQKKENAPEVTVRVEHYKICDEIIVVLQKLPTINGITFYSGIDMNKFSDKYQISFTPVLGFKHDQATSENFTLGFQSVLEFSKGEVFVEYTSPCPPTC